MKMRISSMLFIWTLSLNSCANSNAPVAAPQDAVQRSSEGKIYVEEKSPPPQIDRMPNLVKTINDNFDVFNSDVTPSVTELKKIGPRVIPVMLDLMLSEDRFTRQHAQAVIYGVVERMYGLTPHNRDPADLEKYSRLINNLGRLDWDADPTDRERTVHRWRNWYSTLNAA